MLPSIFNGVRVARSFVLCVVFRRFLFLLFAISNFVDLCHSSLHAPMIMNTYVLLIRKQEIVTVKDYVMQRDIDCLLAYCCHTVRLYLQLLVGWLMSYLRYLCLFAQSGVQHILCCVFICLRLVCAMLYTSSCTRK
jgi:hypothetical protein